MGLALLHRILEVEFPVQILVDEGVVGDHIGIGAGAAIIRFVRDRPLPLRAGDLDVVVRAEGIVVVCLVDLACAVSPFGIEHFDRRIAAIYVVDLHNECAVRGIIHRGVYGVRGEGIGERRALYGHDGLIIVFDGPRHTQVFLAVYRLFGLRSGVELIDTDILELSFHVEGIRVAGIRALDRHAVAGGFRRAHVVAQLCFIHIGGIGDDDLLIVLNVADDLQIEAVCALRIFGNNPKVFVEGQYLGFALRIFILGHAGDDEAVRVIHQQVAVDAVRHLDAVGIFDRGLILIHRYRRSVAVGGHSDGIVDAGVKLIGRFIPDLLEFALLGRVHVEAVVRGDVEGRGFIELDRARVRGDIDLVAQRDLREGGGGQHVEFIRLCGIVRVPSDLDIAPRIAIALGDILDLASGEFSILAQVDGQCVFFAIQGRIDDLHPVRQIQPHGRSVVGELAICLQHLGQ